MIAAGSQASLDAGTIFADAPHGLRTAMIRGSLDAEKTGIQQTSNKKIRPTRRAWTLGNARAHAAVCDVAFTTPLALPFCGPRTNTC